MTTKLFNQCDPAWASHAMGSGPGHSTLCAVGCYVDVFSTILNATGHPTNPAKLDELLTAKKVFLNEGGGLYDILTDNTLDKLYPGEYKTTTYAGYRADIVKAGVSSPNMYVVYRIEGYSSLWKMVVGHFALAWSSDGKYVGDPQGGVARLLSGYGGTMNVKRTILVKVLPKTPVPVPIPVTFRVVSVGVVIEKGLTQNSAIGRAKALATSHVGIVYTVANESTGVVVDTEFVAPAPSPVPPSPLPTPTPIDGHQELAAILQNFLVALLLLFRKQFAPTTVQH